MESESSKPILQGDYKIIKVLQKLPYSTYYLGTSAENPEKRWAIKELRMDFDTKEEEAEILALFEGLAPIYSRLKHPQLVPLRNYFTENGFVYIIFDFVPGHRLGEIFEIRKEPFTEDQVLDFSYQVADALTYLHKRKVIFHDLNPSNIIITPEGTIRLTDYGIGKMLTRRQSDAPLWGTPGYAPPEQYGKDAVLSEAADIYALGAIMHQMLTLKNPVQTKGIFEPVRKLNNQVSEDMETLIHNATISDIGLRYQVTREFLDDVRKLASVKLQIKPEEENWLKKLAKELAKPFRRLVT
jgi:eukaryotic-like serine/threonine-protein kinase